MKIEITITKSIFIDTEYLHHCRDQAEYESMMDDYFDNRLPSRMDNRFEWQGREDDYGVWIFMEEFDFPYEDESIEDFVDDIVFDIQGYDEATDEVDWRVIE